MVLVPTDFMRLAMNSFHEGTSLMCLELEHDLDTEEEKSKEKSKEKNKFNSELQALKLLGFNTAYDSYSKRFNHLIRPSVLYLEIHTPPPEQSLKL